MFYRLFRAFASFNLNSFFRVEKPVDPHGGLSLDGPVMYVGNHPNALIDPGLIFVLSKRQVTFLAKEPLFRFPVLGQVLRGVGALPVYRKQDGADTSKNEGTLTAATQALVDGRAITIFPEGKSTKDPHIIELKTGAARIALAAKEKGVTPKIVPVGMTYAARNRFRSKVHIEIGEPFEAAGEVRELTANIDAALRKVTLNLEAWEDLPLIKTADQLLALQTGNRAGDPERLKRFARGMQLLRAEQPERFERVKSTLTHFQQQLSLLAISADDLTSRYRPATVALFVIRNLLWMLSLPLVALGFALYAIPFMLTRLAAKLTKVEWDIQGTIKFLTAMVLAPIWWALLTFLSWRFFGAIAAAVTFIFAIPLALFTRVFYERRLTALRDARTFFVLGSRKRMQRQLLDESRELATKIEALAEELRPRL